MICICQITCYLVITNTTKRALFRMKKKLKKRLDLLSSLRSSYTAPYFSLNSSSYHLLKFIV